MKNGGVPIFGILSILYSFCVYHIHHCLDSCLTFQVRVADGIQYVGKLANSAEPDEVSVLHRNGDTSCGSKSPKENCVPHHIEDSGLTKVDIVIIDVDSSDSR